MPQHVDFIIAVDGGGTKCQLCLYSSAGKILAETRTGPANINTDQSHSIHNVLSGIEQLEQLSGISIEPKVTAICAGFAGANIHSKKQAMISAFDAYYDVSICSDLEISCIAANKGEDCGVIITGTGSSIARYQNQQFVQIGGHGFILGDHGSGASLGQALLREYMLYLDTLRADDPIYKILAVHVGRDINRIVENFAMAPPRVYAQFAPLVFEHATESQICKKLQSQAIEYLSDIIERRLSGLPLFIDGGLAQNYQKLLNENILIEVVKRSACEGAFLKFMQHYDAK